MSERANPTDDPGLVLGDDGIVYEVASDGTRTALGSGGSMPANWCSFTLANCPTFDTGTTFYEFQVADIGNLTQSGDDFSIGVDIDGHAGVLSAAGGTFIAAIYLSAPFSGVTVDGGHPGPRYLWFACTTGNPEDPLNPFVGVGLDGSVEILASWPDNSPTYTFQSMPGYTPAGGAAVSRLSFQACNFQGTDSVQPLDATLNGAVFVWQTYPLT
jgi:hypothetical protein